MAQPDQDLLLGKIPEKKSRILARWTADCGSFPSPQLEHASVVEGLLVAPCNRCATQGCLVRRELRTVLL